MPGRLRHFGDRLDASGTGPDDSDPLADETDWLLRPIMRVERRTLETADPRNVRQCRRGQDTDRGDQKTGSVAPTIFQGDLPTA
jgi:hypothetical protein